METIELITIIIAGALGSLTKDILEDNKIKLPKIMDDELALGCLGGIITGAIAGYLIDGSPVTAFMGGFTGSAVFASLIDKKSIETTTPTEEPTNNEPWTEEKIKRLIKDIANSYNIDVNLALKVAECESSFNPKARNINAPDSIDRGLYQINNKYHPEVSDEQADNPEFATKWFCQAVKDGNLSWWNSSNKCWGCA